MEWIWYCQGEKVFSCSGSGCIKKSPCTVCASAYRMKCYQQWKDEAAKTQHDHLMTPASKMHAIESLPKISVELLCDFFSLVFSFFIFSFILSLFSSQLSLVFVLFWHVPLVQCIPMRLSRLRLWPAVKFTMRYTQYRESRRIAQRGLLFI